MRSYFRSVFTHIKFLVSKKNEISQLSLQSSHYVAKAGLNLNLPASDYSVLRFQTYMAISS